MRAWEIVAASYSQKTQFLFLKFGVLLPKLVQIENQLNKNQNSNIWGG